MGKGPIGYRLVCYCDSPALGPNLFKLLVKYIYIFGTTKFTVIVTFDVNVTTLPVTTVTALLFLSLMSLSLQSPSLLSLAILFSVHCLMSARHNLMSSVILDIDTFKN